MYCSDYSLHSEDGSVASDAEYNFTYIFRGGVINDQNGDQNKWESVQYSQRIKSKSVLLQKLQYREWDITHQLVGNHRITV